jgi:hypothetical protein
MRLIAVAGFLMTFLYTRSQTLPYISQSEVKRIEQTLASDDMQGRKVFTPGLEKAASFIVTEFKNAGLIPLKGKRNFAQSFTMVDPLSVESIATLDHSPVNKKNIVVFSAETALKITPKDHYTKLIVKNSDEFSAAFAKYMVSKKNVIILVDTSLSKRFSRLAGRHMPQFLGTGNRIFILTSADPKQYTIECKQKTKNQILTNLVGMIPGKSKPDEFVIFSAHYDHLGIGKPDASGDSIYNGANDDASGVTAVIMLANYFYSIRNNERTVVFVAFTAEEIGEFGSSYFANKVDPQKLVAMFNIEMIGTESKWGKNSAYITGFEKSDMGSILQKSLQGTPFHFYPDPYPEQELFLRSDNASLAKLGVPAHTISTSKMDSEKYYHTQGDGIETLDMQNMTEIIQAIALSAGSIISRQQTPARVKF